MTNTTKNTPKNISKKKSNKKVRRKKHYPFAFSESTKKKSILGGVCFGKIYLMNNLIDKQKYAVKHIDIKKIQTFLTLFKGKPISRPKTLDFIFNESKILAKLDHPNVTRYYNRAIKITDVQDLGDVMINQLTDLFVEKSKKTVH